MDLDLDSTYYVQISSTAIVHSDCADLSFAGISDTTTATFSTDAGPQAPQASVTNGSPSDTGIVQIYDRPVEAGTGSIVIKNSSNVTVATIPATSSAVTFEDYT